MHLHIQMIYLKNITKKLCNTICHTHTKHASINNKSAKTRRDRDPQTGRARPWFRRRLHMGSTCMKGPSFWCSATNSDRYWLQQKKKNPPFSFMNQKHTNSSKTNQTDMAKSKGCFTKSPHCVLFLFFNFDLKKKHHKKGKPTHLSSFGLLLITRKRNQLNLNPKIPYFFVNVAFYWKASMLHKNLAHKSFSTNI